MTESTAHSQTPLGVPVFQLKLARHNDGESPINPTPLGSAQSQKLKLFIQFCDMELGS